MLPTLEEFMARTGFPTNSFVTYPEFEELYVRKSRRHMDGVMRDALDLARIKAETPGSGAFTRLSEHLLSQGINLYVESVQNPRFERKLLELGFTASETSPFCYYKVSHAHADEAANARTG